MNASIARRSCLLCLALGLGTTSALGQTVFIVRAGDSPIPGQTFTAKGGDALQLEVWVDDIPLFTKLRGFQATIPCKAEGGDVGSIDYPDGTEMVYPIVDVNHPDYVFAGLTTPIVDDWYGDCPSSLQADFPYAHREVDAVDSYRPTVPKYMATFTYDVSTDAEGTFTLDPSAATVCGKLGTYLRKQGLGLVCFDSAAFDGVTIDVPTGRCCIDDGCSLSCQADKTQYHCENTLGGVFTADVDCTGGCPCQTGLHCDDADPCTTDQCSEGICANPSNALYGDISPCGGDGDVSFKDISAVVDAFQANYACEVCDGSGGECGAAMSAASSEPDRSAPAPARIRLTVVEKARKQGDLFHVDVYARDVVDLQKYHLSVEVTGGRSGHLDLASAFIDRHRPDYVFEGRDSFVLLVDKTRASLGMIQLDGDATSAGPVYLGTFRFRPSLNAHGKFRVNLQAGDGTVLLTSFGENLRPDRIAGATIHVR